MLTPLILAAILLAADPLTDLKAWLATPINDRAPLERQPFAVEPLTRARAEEAAALLWDQRLASLRAERKPEWDARSITIDDKTMKFDFKTFGTPDAGGRRLFISMHGGGSAPAAVNEQQWRNQLKLYAPAEGIYLAPRAPTDAWNMWHEAHIDGFFDRIIADAIALENVDPDRVYLMGYSAGGDGVYQLAPRTADRWAAAAMMAGHPNEASPVNLRNLPFAIHMGADDGAFNRNKVAAEWGVKLDELQKADPAGYVHLVQLHEGRGHWMNRQEASAVEWMASRTRDSWPRKIVWRQDDVIAGHLYWLSVDRTRSEPGVTIIASVEGNRIRLEAPESLGTVLIALRDELLDLDKPVIVEVGGRELVREVVPRTIAAMVSCLADRADPKAMGTARIGVDLTPEQK